MWYWRLDCRMGICSACTNEFQQVPAPPVLKAIAVLVSSRRWHISCLHVTQYHLEKAGTALSTNSVIWFTRAMLAVRADSVSIFCAGGSRAVRNMASVTQEGCTLRHAVCGSSYFIFKSGNGQGVAHYRGCDLHESARRSQSRSGGLLAPC